MIPFPERIKVIFSALDTTAHKFANAHGLNRTTVFNLLNEDRRPNFELIERICQAEPRISAEFLVRGEGEPLRDKLQAQTMATLDQLNALKAEINAPLDKRIQELGGKLTPEEQ